MLLGKKRVFINHYYSMIKNQGRMKVKRFIAYLYVILPLFIIGLYQHYQKLDSPVQINKIQLGDNFILLKINESGYEKISKAELEKEVVKISNKEEAITFLNKNLKRAKLNQDSAFAGFAIAGYSRFNRELKIAPEILSQYSDLLSFTHQFKLSTEILEKLSSYPRFYESAVIRLLNIKMLKGDLIGVKEQCLRTKSFTEIKVYIACQVWIKGMVADDQEKVSKYASQLFKLSTLDKLSASSRPFENWLLQMSMDLYLKSNLLVDAQLVLNKIYQKSESTEQADLAPLIQMVDYLILNQKFDIASEMIDQYDNNKKLVVRRALIAKNLKKNLKIDPKSNSESTKSYAVAENIIQSYILTKDTSKYRLVAIWNAFMKSDFNEGKKYADQNLKEYTTFIDLLATKKIDEHSSNITILSARESS